MRKVIEPQMKFGESDIRAITFDPRSRDEIPKLLRGLQYIYCTPQLHEEVFSILEEIVPPHTDPHNGRPGMEMWKILVLGSLRLICNWDYDKLKEIADNHRTLRQMLGHGFDDDDKTYPIQTLKDNVSLLTPEILDRINQIVVKAGHKLLGKKKEQELHGHCDSFVVKTNIHFPTDISLLLDAMRKVITLTARICLQEEVAGWRQSGYLVRKIRRLFNTIRNLKRSTSKNERVKAEREKEIKKAYRKYLLEAESLLERAQKDLIVIRDNGFTSFTIKSINNDKTLRLIEYYMAHAEHQIDQIWRREIRGETIPHKAKIFSIFEPHTKWIVKGKAGVPQELGLNVGIIKDQHGFILYHRVMENVFDVDVAVPLTAGAKDRFSALAGCSYDRGFYSPDNLINLQKIIDKVALPKKGRLSVVDREREYSSWFIHARRQHPAVESAINALENHGLDRCPDHGIDGFERYVGLAILARNLQLVGDILQRKHRKRLRRMAA